MHWLPDLTRLLLTFFYHHELLALALILLPEEAGVPMPPPGYTLLIIAGAEPGRSLFSALSVVAVAASASFVGSCFTFSLTRRFGRETLLRWAHRLRVKQSRIEQMQRWMERYGRAGIFAGRLIPGLRVPTIFVAGLTGMRMSTFAIIDAGAALIWAGGYFWLGALLEPKLTQIRGEVLAMSRPWQIAIVASLSLLAILGVVYWMKRQRNAAHTMQAAHAEPITPSRTSIPADSDTANV
jgi:membrane protein DedA with SNARE-associated domain